MELLANISTEEFMRSLKQFIAKRGQAVKSYSDNAQTLVTAARRIQKNSESEKVNDLLAKNNIECNIGRNIERQLNLSKAPLRGGQYEGLIGLVKPSMYKVLR